MNEPAAILLHTYSARFQFRYLPEFDIFAFIELASMLGFQGVAISANDENYRHLESKEAAQFAKIRQHLERYDLICDMDTSGTVPLHLKEMLDVAHQIGARHLRTYTRYPFPEALQKTIHDLRQVGDIAASLNVQILLENHESFTGTDIAEIISQVDHPNIKALFDFGNSQMVLEDPLAALENMLSFARSAHIKDHVILPAPNGEPAAARVLGVPLGDGNLPIPQMTQRLYEAGLREFVFENSRGYHAPFKAERLTPETIARIGKNSFAFAAPPLENKRYWIDTAQLSSRLLVEQEYASLLESWHWLRQLFNQLEIPLQV